MSMFCYQCEQTAQGTGCTSVGICGKTPETSKLQDLIVYLVKGISCYAHAARRLGFSDPNIDDTCLAALFMTLTNVNFDENEHLEYIQYLGQVRQKAAKLYEDACLNKSVKIQAFTGPALWEIPCQKESLILFADTVSIMSDFSNNSAELVGLKELLIYGVKGLSAYAHHARALGYSSEMIPAFVQEALSYLTENDLELNKLLSLCLKAGEINFETMRILDKAHTETFGHPQATSVLRSHKKGKCILVSGHDLKALYELLKQTEAKGISVYTHGEMLPAHAYPELNKFVHLVGNYGGAWQNQVKEFAEFPGPILMTTNCLKPPADSYKNRLFTYDVVAYDGISKIKNFNFSELIESAYRNEGFQEDENESRILVGFGHNQVLSVADKVIEAVKTGKIRHFFLVGGCDGAEFSRNYFTEFAESVPNDCVILTLGCGKYRLNDINFGEVAGIPRLLDLGQCNDAYSAVIIAEALADAFKCRVNELPLSLVISWFEQKAVAVLLTLLYLGIKDIRLGPNMPAFINGKVLDLLVSSYGIKAVGTPRKDLAEMLGETVHSGT